MLVTVKRTNQDFTSSSPTTIAVFSLFGNSTLFSIRNVNKLSTRRRLKKETDFLFWRKKRNTEKRMEERTRWTRITGTSDVSLCSGIHGNVNIGWCKRAPGMLAPPPLGPISLISVQKSCQIIGFWSKFRGCTPSRLGNLDPPLVNIENFEIVSCFLFKPGHDLFAHNRKATWQNS